MRLDTFVEEKRQLDDGKYCTQQTEHLWGTLRVESGTVAAAEEEEEDQEEEAEAVPLQRPARKHLPFDEREVDRW